MGKRGLRAHLVRLRRRAESAARRSTPHRLGCDRDPRGARLHRRRRRPAHSERHHRPRRVVSSGTGPTSSGLTASASGANVCADDPSASGAGAGHRDLVVLPGRGRGPCPRRVVDHRSRLARSGVHVRTWLRGNLPDASQAGRRPGGVRHEGREYGNGGPDDVDRHGRTRCRTHALHSTAHSVHLSSRRRRSPRR